MEFVIGIKYNIINWNILKGQFTNILYHMVYTVCNILDCAVSKTDNDQ